MLIGPSRAGIVPICRTMLPIATFIEGRDLENCRESHGTFFWPKIFWTQHFVEPKICVPRIFWTYNFFGHKIFFYPKFFFTQNFFGPKIFLDPKFFWTLNFFDPHFFWPTIFWTQKFFGPKNISDLDPKYL